MASKKDMRRDDLIIPFIEPESEKPNDMSSTLSSTLPMAAMFTRQKMIGWVSFVFAVQNWLAETPDSRKGSGTPGYFAVGMSFLATLVCYMQYFLPPPSAARGVSDTGAQAPAPPSHG